MNKEKFVKDLVMLLLKSEQNSEDAEILSIDRKTFHHMILYILMEEVLEDPVSNQEIEVQLAAMMDDIQQEIDEMMTLLTELIKVE